MTALPWKRFTAKSMVPIGVSIGIGITGCFASERNPSKVRKFRAIEPCPATNLHKGRCEGRQVDRITPLRASDADHPNNMQWIRTEGHRMKTLVDVRECRR